MSSSAALGGDSPLDGREDTPLMRQWKEVKSRNRDALLFFRVGDFYELFYEDAQEGARLLGLTLTSRNNGSASAVPLAGIPVKALDDYLNRLVETGRRVAICEQVEDPATAQGIVRREVVETVTPGTVISDTLLRAARNNFLVALAGDETGPFGLAALDLSTGELSLQQIEEIDLAAEIGRWEPSELLIPRSLEGGISRRATDAARGASVTYRDDWLFDGTSGRDELLRRYRLHSLEGLGFQPGDHRLAGAAGALLAYVKEIRPGGSAQLRQPVILRPGDTMLLDEMTRRNLELVEPLRSGEEGGTLVAVLDRTVTAMGARLLRRWILHPLIEAAAIWARQEAVEEIVERPELREALRRRLGRVGDLERLAGRAGAGRCTPRDLLALGRSLGELPGLLESLEEAGAGLLVEMAGRLDPLHDVRSELERGLADTVPANLQDGGVIRAGFSAELDRLREIRDGARDFIASLQARERERTGIGSLKVGFNKVFGYYLEVTRPNLDRVPDDFIRKQTLSNCERFFTPELKEWEEKVMGAEDRILSLETELFQELRGRVAGEATRIQGSGGEIAKLDVLATLAEVAVGRGYVRPEVHSGFDLDVREGRHPVVETMMPRESFIPNDVELDDEGRIVILTGPNMAGKSTVLRQVGLIQLLGQMGSFVPADRARLPVCDRIFTRVGASDNLARGQSTFMVEMHETSSILHGATRSSLVLLDEIGRGTSTYDGVSIAWAVTEHLHAEVGCKTIFATHYHELTELGDLLEGVKNMNVLVKEAGEEVVFLRRLGAGGADRSYGIQVARLAGLPPAVVARARSLLAQLEGTRSHRGPGRSGEEVPGAPPSASGRQLSLFNPEDHPVLERLRTVDILEVTPLQALNLLAELKAGSGGSHVDDAGPSRAEPREGR